MKLRRKNKVVEIYNGIRCWVSRKMGKVYPTNWKVQAAVLGVKH